MTPVISKIYSPCFVHRLYRRYDDGDDESSRYIGDEEHLVDFAADVVVGVARGVASRGLARP